MGDERQLPPLAALTCDRFGQKRIFLAGSAPYGLGATVIGFAPPCLVSTARSHAPGASSQSLCSAESCSRAILSCSQDSTWE